MGLGWVGLGGGDGSWRVQEVERSRQEEGDGGLLDSRTLKLSSK
jgi:hypothetical protein